MRIAVACEFASLNGGERSLLALLDQAGGPEVTFCLLAPPEGALAKELARRQIEHVPLSLLRDDGRKCEPAEAAERLRRRALLARPDLLHGNSVSMSRLTGRIAADVPFPCTGHLRDILNLSAATVRDLNGNVRLIAVSQATRNAHLANGLEGARCEVIYNGVDPREFAPRPRVEGYRASLGIPNEAFSLLTIGQIGLRKGQDLLPQAAALLDDEPEPCHFVIVGRRHSQKAESVAFERAVPAAFSRLGQRRRLHLLGRRDDVPQLMSQMDLLVHPARQEPFGRVLLEAAAAGLPIVASDVGGTGEMLEHGVSAMLIPPDDPAALAEAIAELRADPARRADLAAAARRRVIQRFPIAEAARRTLEFWRRCLSSGGSSG